MLQYRYLDAAGYFLEDQVIFDQSKLTGFSLTDYSSVRQMFIVPLEDYNRLMGTEETLEAHEVLLYSTKSDYSYDTISLEGGETWRIKKTVPGFVDNGVDAMQIISSVFLFVPDMETVEIFFDQQAEAYGDNRSYKHDYLGFDLRCSDEKANRDRRRNLRCHT